MLSYLYSADITVGIFCSGIYDKNDKSGVMADIVVTLIYCICRLWKDRGLID